MQKGCTLEVGTGWDEGEWKIRIKGNGGSKRERSNPSHGRKSVFLYMPILSSAGGGDGLFC